jgi:hypothetical protein
VLLAFNKLKGTTMFASAVAYLESKTPTWVKILVALVVVGWMTPLKVREWTYDLIDTRVHAVILPLKVQRDNEILNLHTKIETLNEKADETNAFVKAMALEQLGAKRYQQVNLTNVDSTK